MILFGPAAGAKILLLLTQFFYFERKSAIEGGVDRNKTVGKSLTLREGPRIQMTEILLT